MPRKVREIIVDYRRAGFTENGEDEPPIFSRGMNGLRLLWLPG